MKIHEYQGKEVLRQAGVPVPRGIPAFTVQEAVEAAQKLGGSVEAMLADAGFELTAVAEKHLCCGSAGTYSILQPKIASQLKSRKLGNLQAGSPEMIVTANIGCLTHLQSGTETPVKHWVELLDEVLAAS
jgi:glycolate oxidase iron-sulfur subunit